MATKKVAKSVEVLEQVSTNVEVAEKLVLKPEVEAAVDAAKSEVESTVAPVETETAMNPAAVETPVEEVSDVAVKFEKLREFLKVENREFENVSEVDAELMKVVSNYYAADAVIQELQILSEEMTEYRNSIGNGLRSSMGEYKKFLSLSKSGISSEEVEELVEALKEYDTDEDWLELALKKLKLEAFQTLDGVRTDWNPDFIKFADDEMNVNQSTVETNEGLKEYLDAQMSGKFWNDELKKIVLGSFGFKDKVSAATSSDSKDERFKRYVRIDDFKHFDAKCSVTLANTDPETFPTPKGRAVEFYIKAINKELQKAIDTKHPDYNESMKIKFITPKKEGYAGSACEKVFNEVAEKAKAFNAELRAELQKSE